MTKEEQKLEQKLEQKKIMNKKYIIGISFLIGIIILVFCLKKQDAKILYDYYPNSILASQYEYIVVNKDTLLHGKFVRYNKKGDKIAEGNFKNGEPIGKIIYYFDNGIIESILYRKNSKIVEESIDNFQSGKIMRYTSYDDFGMSAFIIRFDENGNVENYKGYPLMETYQYKIANKQKFKIKTNQVLKVGDTLKYHYLIANIPIAKRSFKIENLDVDNSKVKRVFTQIPPTGINVKEVLTQKGTNTIRAIVKYEFHDKEKTIINDTISFSVNVN